MQLQIMKARPGASARVGRRPSPRPIVYSSLVRRNLGISLETQAAPIALMKMRKKLDRRKMERLRKEHDIFHAASFCIPTAETSIFREWPHESSRTRPDTGFRVRNRSFNPLPSRSQARHRKERSKRYSVARCSRMTEQALSCDFFQWSVTL